jgi:hypothetical protein
MVEPLFSTTSTRAEVWLVLRELCLPHPRVDVYAHFCWKCMFTYMVWPLQYAEWMKGLWPVPLSALCSVAVDVNPDGGTTVFHHIYRSGGVAGFMWAESFTSWRGCVCSHVLKVDVNLYGLTTSMCRVGWEVCVCPVPISRTCWLSGWPSYIYVWLQWM